MPRSAVRVEPASAQRPAVGGRHAGCRSIPHLAARWSPRVFDPDAVLTGEQLVGAAGGGTLGRHVGSPPAGPLRRRVPRRRHVRLNGGDAERGNAYAHAASALILVCADEGPDERTALYSGRRCRRGHRQRDRRGGVARPHRTSDGGVQRRRGAGGVRHPGRGATVGGRRGRHARRLRDGSAGVIERDSRPRARLPLDQIAFAGRWGRTAPL